MNEKKTIDDENDIVVPVSIVVYRSSYRDFGWM